MLLDGKWNILLKFMFTFPDISMEFYQVISVDSI